MKALLLILLITFSFCNNVEEDIQLEGYALFAQRKLLLKAKLNSIIIQQSQRSDEQMKLATQTLNLQEKIKTLQSSQSSQLSDLYKELSKAENQNERTKIYEQIEKKQKEFDAEIDEINKKLKETSIKENAIEMEVKRLDTKLTELQKQLEKIEEAERKGIENSTPKFNGLG